MSNKIDYYLIARSRETNQFQVVPIHGNRENSLEEIDLYTLTFKNAEEMEQKLQEQGIISYSNIDFFIVSQGKENNNTIRIQELLYKKQDAIKPITENSMRKKIDNSQTQIDYILDAFASLMESNGIFREQVLTGKTSIYPMYTKYFNMTSQKKSHIKYNDGSWARRSYALIRSVVEAMTRGVTYYSSMSDQMYRELIKESLLRMIDKEYDPDQLVLSNFFQNQEDQEKEEKLLEVLMTFEGLPMEIMTLSEDGVFSINTKQMSNMDQETIEKLRTSLPQELCQKLYTFLCERNRLDSLNRGMLRYQDSVKRAQKDLLNILQQTEMLNCAYSWCKLYNSNQDQMIGGVHEKRYRSKKPS